MPGSDPRHPARVASRLAFALLLASTVLAAEHTPGSRKVYVITDMEGVDGIFDTELQCNPYESPRFEESRKLLTDELNAAVKGLYEGGATEVVVLDGHDGSRTLSVLDIDPRVRLLAGHPISLTLELDNTYGALVFIGQHSRAAGEKGILTHSFSSGSIQNFWINGQTAGEIGVWVMVAGSFGIPAVMLSGDTAACQEIHRLVPRAECAEVKSGVSRTAGFMLSHPAACALIRAKARRAMEQLPEFKPYQLSGPVEIKVEYTTEAQPNFRPREGVEKVDSRTWVFRGKNIVDAWQRYSAH